MSSTSSLKHTIRIISVSKFHDGKLHTYNWNVTDSTIKGSQHNSRESKLAAGLVQDVWGTVYRRKAYKHPARKERMIVDIICRRWITD